MFARLVEKEEAAVVTTGEGERSRSLAQLLDEAVEGIRDVHDIVSAFEQRSSIQDDAHSFVVAAFRYELRRFRKGSPEGREAFIQMLGGPNGSGYPWPIAEVPAEACEVWKTVSDHSGSSIVRARLNDLLFERRWGAVGEHAREAIRAYLEMTDLPNLHLLERMDAVKRGLDLVKQTKTNESIPRFHEAAYKVCQEALASLKPVPGVTLRLLAMMIDEGSTDSRLDEFLTASRAAYKDAFNEDDVIQLQLKREANPAAREALNRDRVQVWIDEANRSEPMVKLVHLQKALQMARQLGLTDIAESTAKLLQETDPETLGLKRISAKVEIDEQVIEDYLDQFLDFDNWTDALLHFVVGLGPLTGDPDENRDSAKRSAEEAPLHALFPRTRLGPDGLPRYTTLTDEDKAEASLVDQEVHRLGLMGSFTGEILDRIGEKFGIPEEDDLQNLWAAQSRQVSSPIARTLARGYRHLWAGEYEAAACTVLPKVEALARNIAKLFGIAVFVPQEAKTRGQYAGFGATLTALRKKGVLDEAWFRYLSTFLVSPFGMNYRNDLLHGFVASVARDHAAMTLHAASALTLLRPSDSDT